MTLLTSPDTAGTAVHVPTDESRPTPPPTARRLDALDRFRGAALVAMLLHHLLEWLSGDARQLIPGWESLTVTDVAAPAFFVAAGASCSLLVASRTRRGWPVWRIAGIVVRRYGLLVPVGVTLVWVLWSDPVTFGVLEALGVTVMVGAVVAALMPNRLLVLAAAVALYVGVMVERGLEGRTDWLAFELLGGKFPAITYLGFVLVGMAAIRSGRFTDRRWIAGAVLTGVAATVWMLIDGIAPDRYPGDIGFVVPGLAGTAIAYALCQLDWPASLDRVDRLLRAAATHTFGIFIAHYGIYYLLDRTGRVHSVDDAVSVPVALALALALCAVAPHVPQLPWSLRTGWRRGRASPARPGLSAGGGAVGSAPGRPV
jgi:hypothetical protein